MPGMGGSAMSITTVLEQRTNSMNEKITNLDFGANAGQRWYMKSFLYASLEVTLKAEKVCINILPSKDSIGCVIRK